MNRVCRRSEAALAERDVSGLGPSVVEHALVVEAPVPQAKPWLVRLAPLRIELRTLRQPGTARERALAALDELGVGAGDVFAVRDVYGQMGIVTGTKEHGAVQRAIDRMYRGDRGRAPELERVRVGWYRRR